MTSTAQMVEVAHTRLSTWGNSKATRIPTEALKQANVSEGQEFLVSVQQGNIVLSPVKKEPSSLKELFENWTDDGVRASELDWGKAQGKELQW